MHSKVELNGDKIILSCAAFPGYALNTFSMVAPNTYYLSHSVAAAHFLSSSERFGY